MTDRSSNIINLAHFCHNFCYVCYILSKYLYHLQIFLLIRLNHGTFISLLSFGFLFPFPFGKIGVKIR